MKKLLSLAAALLLLISVCIISAYAEENQTVVVHTVDELIAAIAPGAEIRLAAGTYELAQAASYGERTGNPYVKWEDNYGMGYVLLIHDVDGLAITGDGKEEVRLIAESRCVDVLSLEDCTGVFLSGFTGGHSVQAEGCAAGVIRLYRCDDVQLDNLGLYGCGTVGVNADRIRQLTITDSEIYDCSGSGLQFYDVQDVTITGCSFHDIGKTIDGYQAGYAVISCYSGSNVTVSGCKAENNTVSSVLVFIDSQSVRLESSAVTGNSAFDGMLQLRNSELVITSDCVFADNSFSRWYARNWDGAAVQRAVNEYGEVMFPEDPAPVHTSSDPVEPIPVTTGQQKQVMVSDVNAFLAAIGSDTELVLTGGEFDLSKASDYGTAYASGSYTWEETYDGYMLVIRDVDNLSIVTDDGMKSLHTVAAAPRYADVLHFRDCSHITVSGLTAGHTTEPSQCAGGVLYFEHCVGVLVDNCNLYGCGILGVTAWDVVGMQITNSCIYDCSYGGISCYAVDTLTIGGCSFWDLGGDTFQLESCSNVTIDGKEVGGTYYGR